MLLMTGDDTGDDTGGERCFKSIVDNNIIVVKYKLMTYMIITFFLKRNFKIYLFIEAK